MTSTQKVAEEILYQRKIKFSLHPSEPKMVTIGSDNDMVIWDTDAHTAIYSDTLANEPTCIKFSTGPEVFLTTGYVNGTVEISTISGERNKKKHAVKASTLQRGMKALDSRGDLSKKVTIEDPSSSAIIYKVLQSINESTDYVVLNIAFSISSTQMAISYLNKKEPEDGEEKVTGYVSVYKYNKEDVIKKDSKDPLYIRTHVIKSSQCLSITQSGNHACYFMNFTSNDQYLCMNFQQFDKYQLREHDDKERNYLVWDLTKNEKQENMDLVIETKVGNLNFPNHINAQYRYHEKYLEMNTHQQTEG
jgi:hypothetical protein